MCNGCKNGVEHDEYDSVDGNTAIVSLTVGTAILLFMVGFILIQYV